MNACPCIHTAETKTVFGFSHSWFGEGLTTYNLAVILLVILALFVISKRNVRKHIINHLMKYAIIVFGAGVVLYSCGFWYEGSEGNIVACLLRSATASMEMFVSESELIEVREACKEDVIYMLLFAVTHFLAICVSAAFIIHLLGTRLKSYVFMRCPWSKKKELFVFFDLSQESLSLAKDIHRTRKSKDYQIIFVKTPMEESHLERFSFSHILSFADNRNETIEQLTEIGAFLTYSRKSVSIGINENEWNETVGLNTLHRYIQRIANDEKFNTHFFCLSPNEENNINTAVALSKRYSDDKKFSVYCRANHDSLTESFANLNLKFIDSANLAVMELKKKVEYQPVSFVKPDTKMGVATKPFRSMIVGFGETGFEVFRFLYEFSSFVGKESKENPFHCDIIDPKAKQRENSLYLHCPGLEDKANKDEVHTILFHEGTIESQRNVVKELICNVDYIVVCTDNEKENLSIGIALLNLAYKYRSNSEKLAIFIGINDNREYKKAQEIAKFYNECGKKDKEGNLYEFTLIPFGSKKQLFTYKNIIDEDVLNKAKEFYFEYQKTSNLLGTDKEYDCEANMDDEWDLRRKVKKQNVAKGLWNKNELTQKEAQDMANAWHIQTKLHLVGACCYCKDKEYKCVAKERHAQLYGCIDFVMQKLLVRMEKARKCEENFRKSHEFILEQIAAYEHEHNIPAGEYQTLFENLAKCEHLRWDASNRLLSYRTFEKAKGNDKHYLQKTHACMVPYEELLANEVLRDTIKYDYNTILVSIKK